MTVEVEGAEFMGVQRRGSTLDDFLRGAGSYEGVQELAAKEVVAWLLADPTRQRSLSTAGVALSLEASGSQLDGQLHLTSILTGFAGAALCPSVARPSLQARLRSAPYPRPGEILLEEFLKPAGFSQRRLAKELRIPRRWMGEIVAGRRSLTPGIARGLAQVLGTSDGFWLGLQADYDAAVARDLIAEARCTGQTQPSNEARAD